MSAKSSGGSATSCGGNWAVVMAGGPGTRFWPESRTQCPKPFLKLLGNKTLLENTVERLYPLFPPSRIFIVLQRDLVQKAKRLLARIPLENILGEPMVRNTAPCCVYAASQIAERDPEARFVFIPSDQEIRPRSLYLNALKTALALADDRPVLLGFQPVSPNPSYGYLEVGPGRKIKPGIALYTVHRFHEKPSVSRARQFLKQGNFLWNGGTFAWRMDAFKGAIQKYLPGLYPAFVKLAPFPGGSHNRSALARIYGEFPKISLDYGVMEKMRNVHCLCPSLDWTDLGGWPGVSEFWPEDSQKNRVEGNAVLIRSRRNLVKSRERLVALLGVDDLVVVDTKDALLVCPRSETEQIREIVRELERRKGKKYL